ncbi:MAG: hypothetical protein AMS24_01965 [Chlamydiae bacterium SM23_39]|nr:MAG: hypothetical protein AMS24_01965 [Chlamydiae bacterium SM23_39]
MILDDLKKGFFFIVSAPSGGGKTTLVKRLTDEYDSIVRSISYTTREKRNDEIDGKDYFFVNENEFEKKIRNDEFLEYVRFLGYYYGTDRKFVENNINRKKHVVLTIDVQGAMNLKKKNIGIFIFLKPPSMQILKKRLEIRQTEDEEKIKEKMELAKKEIEVGEKYYDYIIVNDDIDVAYKSLVSIFIAEENKNRKIGKL